MTPESIRNKQECSHMNDEWLCELLSATLLLLMHGGSCAAEREMLVELCMMTGKTIYGMA